MPIGPLCAAVSRNGGLAALLAGSRTATSLSQRAQWRLRRAWCRGVSTGLLTPAAADHLAVHLLGVTPWEVWGPIWDTYDVYASKTRHRHQREGASNSRDAA